jgi:hypothetical protein
MNEALRIRSVVAERVPVVITGSLMDNGDGAGMVMRQDVADSLGVASGRSACR